MAKRLRRSRARFVRNYLYQGNRFILATISRAPDMPTCEARTKHGESGTTGKAGGDHVHFSMQLERIQIDFKEWDGMPTWVEDQSRNA